ncbi:hypothetical protein KXV18_006124 [Aspergillus fumigatus]|nr:hypothetical protein KXV83_004991 [Aspergillus fumigatus]KAH2628226.1 hypothetical protein KXV18_006124 [Aspergillus fumigatus]
MVIVRLLNGPPTGRSLIGIPQTRDPVNDETEPWFFINGIATGKHWHQSNLTALADTFGRQIVGIHNPTKGVILDLVECLIQRDLETGATSRRARRIYYEESCSHRPFARRDCRVLDHRLAIWRAEPIPDTETRDIHLRQRSEAVPQPAAARAAPQRSGWNDTRRQIQGERAIRNIEHYANTKDFVANIGALQFTASAGAYSNASVFSGTVFIREGSGHLFNMHYLHPMFGEHSAFMESTVDVRPRNGPGKTVSMRMRELSRLYNYKNGRSPEDQDAM